MTGVTCKDILCADQRHILMQNPSYVVQPDFLSVHEWVHSGTAESIIYIEFINVEKGTSC